MGGNPSGQELAHYVKDLADLRPDTVIALNGWNDFSQILHTSGTGGQVLPPHLMGFNWFANMERALVDYSAIRFGKSPTVRVKVTPSRHSGRPDHASMPAQPL